MNNNSRVLSDVIASGRVTGATGVAIVARGCATARTAAGIYTITLDQACDATECVILADPDTAALNKLKVHTSDTVKTLTFETDVGVDTDCDFDFVVYRISGGPGR